MPQQLLREHSAGHRYPATLKINESLEAKMLVDRRLW